MPPRFSIDDILAKPSGASFFDGFIAQSHEKGGLISAGLPDRDGVLVVMSGKLRVYLIGEDREMTLFYLVPGDMFCTHSGCLIEAVERTDIRYTDIGTFAKKLEENPSLAFGLIGILGRAMMGCMRTIEDLVFRDIKQRLAHFFLDRARAAQGDAGAEVRLFIELTVEEIANLVGSSRQTTSAALNALMREGLISRKGRSNYTIADVGQLAAAAGTAFPPPDGTVRPAREADGGR
ncbi:Crp/Fnr family transcriptional regulator [Rhodomicrobium udaipurense JA643]|uniref:Crp/Fnr family transcriptional regulator n=1 Tax=Rhodomicrobium udaipurense TaxID=1202716 RepID=A0A8I1KJE3_9HYPH|nr:Crp/Fnr family transcriptional regulator [Rhodomicrobium udaipurense]KAI95913.1 Crp/Fnr family transcriptional regulator [Rhodomicrobium udaipurense JA643]MBJ7542816.1 Crp/Fnr family transcriptional regulator [Rhodomicrobium udaipurense]